MKVGLYMQSPFLNNKRSSHSYVCQLEARPGTDTNNKKVAGLWNRVPSQLEEDSNIVLVDVY